MPMPIINKDEFEENLLLTQAYCDLRLRNGGKAAAEILRSFNPVIDGKAISVTEIVNLLIKHAYDISYVPLNVPNAYLKRG